MAKTIVITGAGEGLGKALSRQFSADGDNIVLLGRTMSKLESAATEFGQGCMPVSCDIGDPASVRQAFEKIAARHGKIDVLINNAAFYVPMTLEDATDDAVATHIATNIAGPVFVTREATALMQPGGHVINLTSESVELAIPMLWLYAATKTAVERMAKGWRDELGKKGIRVTVVRAGKMFGEGKTGSGWDMDTTVKFAKACAEAGMPMQEQPLTDYASLLPMFRTIVDSPADLNLDLVTLGARRRG